MPHRSVIVKENYGPDGQTLQSLTVMMRVKGFDPDNNDWWWAKYEPDGSIAKLGGKRVVGKVSSCAECHSTAEGGDLVFEND